jgi:hypothetical protein
MVSVLKVTAYPLRQSYVTGAETFSPFDELAIKGNEFRKRTAAGEMERIGEIQPLFVPGEDFSQPVVITPERSVNPVISANLR